MSYSDDLLNTKVSDGKFTFVIDFESDISRDGGYTFERIIEEFPLTTEEIKKLISELEEFMRGER